MNSIIFELAALFAADAFIFEKLSPYGPHAAAILAGFLIPGMDGRLWLTPSGEQYLAQLEKRMEEA